MRTLHLYKNHLKEQPISLRQKLDLMYGHFDPTLEKHVQAFNQSKHATPHGYSLRKRDKAPAKEPPPRCNETFGEGPKKEIPVPMTAPDQAKYVQISNQQVRTFVTRDGRLLGLDGRPVDPDTLHFEKPTNPTLPGATQLKQPQSRPTQPHKRKRTAIDSQDEAATSNKQQAELSPPSHDMPPPPSFNDLGNRFVLFDTTASKVFDALDDENKILLTDLEHKTLGNKMGLSYKNDATTPKKLQRILQGGGSIVIDLNSVRAKDLLTFNSIEAVINGDTSTIWGFRPH